MKATSEVNSVTRNVIGWLCCAIISGLLIAAAFFCETQMNACEMHTWQRAAFGICLFVLMFIGVPLGFIALIGGILLYIHIQAFIFFGAAYLIGMTLGPDLSSLWEG